MLLWLLHVEFAGNVSLLIKKTTQKKYVFHSQSIMQNRQDLIVLTQGDQKDAAGTRSARHTTLNGPRECVPAQEMPDDMQAYESRHD